MARLAALLLASLLLAACGGAIPGDERGPGLAGSTELPPPESTPGPDVPPFEATLRPPPLVLESAAGRQEAVQGSSCVQGTDPATGQGVGICSDTPPVHPVLLTVVRPGDELSVSVLGGRFVEPASVTVRPLGCVDEETASLETSGEPWPVDLPPGGYELDVFARFETDDGRSGDTSGSLGLLVDPGSDPLILAASLERFVCRPERGIEPVTGGTSTQRALLGDILARVGAPAGLTLELTAPPDDRGPAGATWVVIHTATQDAADAGVTQWQGLLAAGAFRDLSASQGLPPVGGYSMDGEGSIGTFAYSPGSAPPAGAWAAAELDAQVRAAADRAGVSLASVVILEPLGLAPLVTVTATSSDAARPLIDALDGLAGSSAGDGYCVVVEDPAGMVVSGESAAVRAGAGGAWAQAVATATP